ncbi:MAG: helix-turn-helix domain-containing protein [Armatimonadota bacterium]|nr:helix-turn-helix domain-containing protein [Armatimonadota bacterium]
MSQHIEIPDPHVEIDDDSAVPVERLRFLQLCAITALVPGTNLSEAAALCGISRMTIWRWSKLPPFQAALQAAREQAFAQASAQLKYASRDAVGVLTRNLDSANPVLAIRSAVAILNHVHKAVYILNHQSPIIAVEKTSNDLDHKGEPALPEPEVTPSLDETEASFDSHIPLLEL